jgi:hypothetical protein
MVAVLRTMRELRPKAKFAYYGLPQGDLWGYRGLGRGGCRTMALSTGEMAARQRQNNKLRPLFAAGGAVYPSIYLNAGYSAGTAALIAPWLGTPGTV